MNTSSIALSALLLVITAFLVAAETALAQTSAVRIEALDDVNDKRRDRVLRLLDKPEALLNPLRLVIVLLEVTEISIVTVMAYNWLGATGMIGPALPNGLAFRTDRNWPTNVGHSARGTGRDCRCGPISGLIGSWPIRFVSRALIVVTNWLVPGKGLRSGPFATPEEFIALADAALEDAVLEKDERDLIESVIEFGDTVVREVMVLRIDMTTVQQTSQSIKPSRFVRRPDTAVACRR
ncbi:MAG: CNNM domain-containing protein [Acidimicrobiales bacterium]